ncbi:MAG: hypothetical protein HDQ87_05875 [Clostridia bacterium]|nr:hypothetical protein [Clostridia bacterium]
MRRAFFAALLICSIAMSACQATPPESVQGKTNQNEEYARTFEDELPLYDYLTKAPTISVRAGGPHAGNVAFDAVLDVPQVSALPVARGQLEPFTDSTVQDICAQFFGSEAVYCAVTGPGREYYERRAEDLERELIIEQQALNEFKDGDEQIIASVDALTGEETDFEITREVLQQGVDAIKKDLAECREKAASTASVEKTQVELKIGSAPYVDYGEQCISAQTSLHGTDYIVLTSQNNCRLQIAAVDPDSYEQMYPIEYQLVEAQAVGDEIAVLDVTSGLETTVTFDPGITQQTAQETAEEFVDQIANDFVPCGVYGSVAALDEAACAYTCFFTREIRGLPVAFEDHAIDTGAAETVPIPYETMSVAVTKDGIVAFDWSDRVPAEEIINENADPLSPVEVADIAVQYIADTTGDIGALSIEHMSLTMMRTQEPNASNTFLYIPVWDFYGRAESEDISFPENYSFATVNAITGAIVDRAVGY